MGVNKANLKTQYVLLYRKFMFENIKKIIKNIINIIILIYTVCADQNSKLN